MWISSFITRVDIDKITIEQAPLDEGIPYVVLNVKGTTYQLGFSNAKEFFRFAEKVNDLATVVRDDVAVKEG